MNLIVIAVIFGLCFVKIHGNIIFKAKFMGNNKVEGDGYSVHALSVSHCLALCNKNKSCDAVTFNDEIKKCRLFKRCVPLQISANNSHYWFYAKRPPVSDDGYFYEERSDTCLKVTNQSLPYELANRLCSLDKGYLAVLYSAELRQLAKEILFISGHSEAWVHPPLKSYIKYAKNYGLRKKRWISTNENNPELDECWFVQNHTIVKQPSCEDKKRLSICQLPTY
ncbi:uncharacterized protein LOC135846546 [Planococcus citri]|uniref:uncharacterized protein LOC135846546 n=1 Tax=Planococcus citri TaxID=170843 RepID=UPI0031F79FF6